MNQHQSQQVPPERKYWLGPGHYPNEIAHSKRAAVVAIKLHDWADTLDRSRRFVYSFLSIGHPAKIRKAFTQHDQPTKRKRTVIVGVGP